MILISKTFHISFKVQKYFFLPETKNQETAEAPENNDSTLFHTADSITVPSSQASSDSNYFNVTSNSLDATIFVQPFDEIDLMEKGGFQESLMEKLKDRYTEKKKQKEMGGIEKCIQEKESEEEKDQGGIEECLEEKQSEEKEEMGGIEKCIEEKESEEEKDQGGIEKCIEEKESEEEKDQGGIQECLEEKLMEEEEEMGGIEKCLEEKQTEETKEQGGNDEAQEIGQEKAKEKEVAKGARKKQKERSKFK